MIKGKRIIAVIPARGGSKRLPRKNILDLAEKPLIAWTIEAAQMSVGIDEIIVTTDDSEIEQVANSFGARVIIRPDHLASDTASSIDVVLHAIESQKEKYDYVLLLQPTSPLRNSKHINDVINMLFEKKADAVISVSETEHSPLWAGKLPEDNNMNNFIRDEVKNARSQDLPIFYNLNGAVYMVEIEKLKAEKSLLLSKNAYAYKMKREESIDIDTLLDFEIANLIMKNFNRG